MNLDQRINEAINNENTNLDLIWAQIKDDHAEVLANKLKYLKITTLTLGYNRIGDAGAVALANNLKDSKITTFNISGNQIRDAGAIALSNNLKDSKITTLYLSKNRITDLSVEALAKNLKDSKITILHLADDEISNLLLPDNEITVQGINILNNVLTHYKYLIKISLPKHSSCTTLAEYYTREFINDTALACTPFSLAKENVLRKVKDNRLLVKKLANFLVHLVNTSDNTDNNVIKNDVIKNISAIRFYQKTDKVLLNKYLETHGVSLKNLVPELNKFIQDNTWMISGICKKFSSESECTSQKTHISDLPHEMILEITSYLQDGKWGNGLQIELLGEG